MSPKQEPPGDCWRIKDVLISTKESNDEKPQPTFFKKKKTTMKGVMDPPSQPNHVVKKTLHFATTTRERSRFPLPPLV